MGLPSEGVLSKQSQLEFLRRRRKGVYDDNFNNMCLGLFKYARDLIGASSLSGIAGGWVLSEIPENLMACMETWRGGSMLTTMVHTTILRKIIDFNRKFGKRNACSAGLEYCFDDEFAFSNRLYALNEGSARFDYKLLVGALKNAFEILSDDQRVAIDLHYFQGLKYSEIAKITKVPVGTVTSRIYYSKKKIANFLLNDQKDRDLIEKMGVN